MENIKRIKHMPEIIVYTHREVDRFLFEGMPFDGVVFQHCVTHRTNTWHAGGCKMNG